MTTTANRRMRIAALGLSTALSVGVLAPFIGSGAADAATSCTTAKANYAKADHKVKADQAKFRKAKKKLRKAKHARKSVHVIRHDKKVVKRVQKHVRADKAARSRAYAALQSCSNGSATPAGTANPLSDLFGQLTGILAGAGAPAQLTDALTQAQQQLASLPLSPDAVTKALNAAQAEIQKNIAALSADPTQDSIPDLLNAILNPLKSGLAAASAPGLPTIITGVQQLLVPLAPYDLSVLTSAIPSGGLPGAGSIPGLGSFTSLLSLLGGGTGLPLPF